MAEQNAMLAGRIVPEAALEGSVNMPQFVGGGGVTEEKDPTVPAWAKQPEKPVYTADEVGAISQDQLGNAVNQALLQAKETGEFDGAPGDDGFSPVAKVEQTSDGAVISITDKEGTTEATISNGKDGNPGVYIGSGDMPEGYNVQIDPNGDAFTPDDFITSPMVGATATAAGKAGLVPAPAAGDNGKFLRGDGTWGEIAIPESGVGGGGGDEVWEEVVNATFEEEVKSFVYKFTDTPLKKMIVMIDTPAASADATYSPVFVGTDKDGNASFFVVKFYPRAIPTKLAASTVIAVEFVEVGNDVYTSVKTTYQPSNGGAIINIGAASPVTSHIVRHCLDAYNAQPYPNVTRFSMETYATFPVGTTIKIIGVRV